MANKNRQFGLDRYSPPEDVSIEDIRRLCVQAGKGNHLQDESRSFHPDVTPPLFEIDDDTSLDAILMPGDGTAIGVIRRRTRSPGDSRLVPDQVHLVVLPSGEAGGGPLAEGIGVSVMSVDLNVDDGYSYGAAIAAQRNIGRADINKATGRNEYTEDKTMSRRHFYASVGYDGLITVRDVGSKNGTSFITASDLLKHDSVGGHNMNNREMLARWVQKLKGNLSHWLPASNS